MKMWQILMCTVAMLSCTSITGEKIAETPPALHAGMGIDELVNAGIKFGGQTLVDSAKILKKQNALERAALAVQLQIIDQYRDWDGAYLINAVKLYQLTAPRDPSEVFRLLINSDRKLARELALQVASEFPSRSIAKALDEKLTDAIEEEEIFEYLLPQLAVAITRNGMKDSYSILKLGLFQTNSDSFVTAMVAVDANQASSDLLDYLAQVPVEELRQLTLVTLDVYACLAALRHLAQSPPALSHAKFEHLFYYAMSRNTAFAQIAREVISRYLPEHSKVLARRFTQMPNWIQVAYIEGSRNNITPTVSLFLQDLRELSAQKEIIEEIDSIRL